MGGDDEFWKRDALERFQKIMQRMGVVRELKNQGVSEGDTVVCDGQELTFRSEELGVENDF